MNCQEEQSMGSKLFSRWAVAAAMWCLAAVAAQAQAPTAGAVAAARELLAAKGGTLMFEPVIPGVVETTKNNLLPTNPSLAKDLNEVSAQLRREFEGKKAELVYEVAIIYAKHFTEQELKDLVTFYKTPLGQKMLREEPIAVEESLKRAQDWSMDFAEVVMGRFRAEMKKRGHDL
jgi:uncharacterized protein